MNALGVPEILCSSKLTPLVFLSEFGNIKSSSFPVFYSLPSFLDIHDRKMRSTRLYLVGDLFDAGKCFTNVAKLNMK